MHISSTCAKMKESNFSQREEICMDKRITKAVRRKIKEIHDKGIVDFAQVKHHFFKEFPDWLNEMTDPRNESYIKYRQSDLVTLGIMKNVCGIESMRQMNEKFNETVCIQTLSILSGNKQLEELPDYGTLNYYLAQLSPECLSDLRKKMITTLIRSKSFNRARLLGKYWRVILDGTGLFHFKEKHCENCLVSVSHDEEGKERKDYYHKVLEAKLILGDKLVLSLGTEFIENEQEDVSKQDCELAAAKRLMKRLKKAYPRLPICILGDGLYCAESIMSQCRKNHWEYILNLKEGRQKNIVKDYCWISEGGGKKEKSGIFEEKGIGGYVNHVERVTGKQERFHVFEYEYVKIEKKREVKTHFMWAGSLEITDRNLEEMIQAGRSRWKIENEGFNNQKNGIYQLEHLNSRNSNAMKNHYLLTQIADILMQLYLACNKLVKELGQSIKNTSSRLLESFRRQPITDEDVSYILRYTTVYLE